MQGATELLHLCLPQKFDRMGRQGGRRWKGLEAAAQSGGAPEAGDEHQLGLAGQRLPVGCRFLDSKIEHRQLGLVLQQAHCHQRRPLWTLYQAVVMIFRACWKPRSLAMIWMHVPAMFSRGTWAAGFDDQKLIMSHLTTYLVTLLDSLAKGSDLDPRTGDSAICAGVVKHHSASSPFGRRA